MSVIRKLLLALLLAAPVVAHSAATTFSVGTADTGVTPNSSGAFTPALNDLLVVMVEASDTTQATATLASSLGGGFTFTQFGVQTFSGAAESVYGFVANQLVSSATSQTVDFDTASDPASGTVIFVYRISGITLTGLSAIRQSDGDNNGSGVTPRIDFATVSLTGNPTIMMLGNLASPAGVTPPVGWTENASGDLGYSTPTRGGEISARDSGATVTGLQWGGSSSAAWGTLGVEISVAAAPSFSAAPSCSAAANGVSCTYTASATSTAYGVGVALADGAPSCTQIKAGQNDGGTAALATGSDANTGSADTIVVTGTNPIAKMDYYFCLNNAGGDSAVDSSQSDKLRSARSGFAIVTMSSHSSTGICNEDTYFTPDCADPDVFEYEDDTNQSADCNVAIDAAGDLTLTPVAPGDCDGQQTFEISYEDASSATTGLFTAPTTGTFASDDTVYINNTAPVCDPATQHLLVLLEEDTAMVSRDLTEVCTDVDGDVLTFSEISAQSLPTGTSLSGTGNKTWSGTPSAENEAGVALEFQACDPAGDCDSYTFSAYVVHLWATTDCDGLSEAACSAAIVVDAPWRATDPGLSVSGTECSDETEGTVISQDPAAAAQISSQEPITVVLAVDCGDPGVERKVVFVLSSLTNLVRWVDYIPVSAVPGCQAGTFEEDGCWATLPLSSTTGKTAWVDYIPVGEVSPDASGKWRYENNGWIPVDDLTP